MRRRDLLSALAGAAAILPTIARAQERERRVGVLMGTPPTDPDTQARLAALLQGLQESGWFVGRNMRLDTRWSAGDGHQLRKDAADLMATNPDVAVAGSGGALIPLQLASRTVPIVFAQAIDPVGTGSVATLSRPGGNTTGFLQFEYSLSAKWLELLKELAPLVKRVAILRDPTTAGGIGQWAVIQAAAQPFGVELSTVDLRDSGQLERMIGSFAGESDGGLITVAAAPALRQRELILALMTQHRLPMVSPYRFFVAGGSLASYGPDLVSQYRRAASYVDRILRGEKPAQLPVQAPTKYELVVNVKTAKALGLTIPSSVLARADDVIE